MLRYAPHDNKRRAQGDSRTIVGCISCTIFIGAHSAPYDLLFSDPVQPTHVFIGDLALRRGGNADEVLLYHLS